MDNNKFCEDIKKICKKNGIVLVGTLRIEKAEDYIADTIKHEITDICFWGDVPDRSGTKLICGAEKKPEPLVAFKPQRCRITVLDKERVMYDGIRSPIDNSMHYNRASYEDHLKRNDCVVVEDSRESTQAKIDAKRRAKEETESTPFEWS